MNFLLKHIPLTVVGRSQNIQKFLILFLFASIPLYSIATSRSWVGSGAGGSGTDFNTASNWSPSGTPTSSDDLTMTLTSDGSCSLSGDITVNSLTVEVQGNTDWYFRLSGNVLTINGAASFNALDYTSSSNFSFLEIDCDGSPGGFVFNGTTQLHTTGTGDTHITANTSSEGSMTFNGNLTIGSSTYTSPAIEPSWIFDGTGTQSVTNDCANHFKPASFTFGVSNSPDVNFTNNQANEDYLTVYDGNVAINNSADVHIDDLNLDSWIGDGSFSVNDNGTLRIGGNSNFPDGYSSETVSSTSTVSYEGDQNQSVTALAAPGYGHLRIAGSNTKTSAASFDIRGDFICEGTWDDGDDTHAFDGTSNQSIKGSVSPTFYNMTVNKATGTLFIAIDTDVDNQLSMQDGPIDLSDGSSGYDLEINNTATTAINWTSGSGAYLVSEKTDVSATLSWDINSISGDHIIPFGNASGVEIPLYITRTTGDLGTVTATTYPTGDDNTPYPPTVTNVDGGGSDNSDYTVNRFWQLDKTGSGTTTVRFYYADVDIPPGGEVDLQPQRWNDSGWDSHADSSPDGSNNDSANNWGEGTGITSFSSWTLASFASPLPIELISFNAYCEEGGALLQWTTASELNNDYFEVQRSINGTDFFTIDNVPGSGNSSTTIEYTYKDKSAHGQLAYYRLKQVDYNGEYEYHGPISLQACDFGEYTAFFGSGVLKLNANLDHDDNFEVYVMDASGKIVTIYRNSASPGLNTYQIANDLSTGLYMIRIESETAGEKFVKIVGP